MLRTSDEGKLLANYAGALTGLYAATLLAYGVYSSDIPEEVCHFAAFLQVYFFIAVLGWSVVEAVYMALRQTLPSFGQSFFTRNYVWIAMATGWGELRCLTMEID